MERLETHGHGAVVEDQPDPALLFLHHTEPQLINPATTLSPEPWAKRYPLMVWILALMIFLISHWI